MMYAGEPIKPGRCMSDSQATAFKRTIGGQRCPHCACWEEIEAPTFSKRGLPEWQGRCRKNAPVANIGLNANTELDEIHPVWPWISHDDWCDQFRLAKLLRRSERDESDSTAKRGEHKLRGA